MTFQFYGNHAEVVFLLAVLLGAVISFAFVPEKAERYVGNATIVSRAASADFVPDGDLSKPVWKDAVGVRFNEAASSRAPHPEAETRVASIWTPGYVYFSFQAKFSKLNFYEGETPEKERWELWMRDVVEVFINPEPQRINHYYEFEVAPNNQWIDLVIDLEKKPFNDAKWDSGFEHATRIDEQKKIWTCEMRIAAAGMSAPPIKAGQVWRLNFYRADGPGDDTQRRFLSWSPLPGGGSFHQPASFGMIRFEK